MTPEKIKPKDREFVENLLKEENTDRVVIMNRVIETNETLTQKDLPKVYAMFAALNRDKAVNGEWIQLESREWIQKERPQ